MMDYLGSRVQESWKSGENAEKVEILSKQRRVGPIHLWKTKIDHSRDAFSILHWNEITSFESSH